jgi:predicted nucleic acid-binding protein
MPPRQNVYLVDTDVISELRKKEKANRGVIAFFDEVASSEEPLYLAAVTIGELRRGVELIRYRGDGRQATLLERWLDKLLVDFSDHVLPFDSDAAQLWGRLRVPHPENPLDKQVAATALIHDLVLVTRNVKHFSGTGVNTVNPFTAKT